LQFSLFSWYCFGTYDSENYYTWTYDNSHAFQFYIWTKLSLIVYYKIVYYLYVAIWHLWWIFMTYEFSIQVYGLKDTIKLIDFSYATVWIGKNKILLFRFQFCDIPSVQNMPNWYCCSVSYMMQFTLFQIDLYIYHPIWIQYEGISVLYKFWVYRFHSKFFWFMGGFSLVSNLRWDDLNFGKFSVL
jgi:hypothetical protein